MTSLIFEHRVFELEVQIFEFLLVAELFVVTQKLDKFLRLNPTQTRLTLVVVSLGPGLLAGVPLVRGFVVTLDYSLAVFGPQLEGQPVFAPGTISYHL